MKRTRIRIAACICYLTIATMSFSGIAMADGPAAGTASDPGDSLAAGTAAGTEQASLSDCEWLSEIDEMLDDAEYVKGEVVAGVETGQPLSKGAASADESSDPESSRSLSEQLIGSGEKLMGTSADDEDFDILLIKSRRMTTRQILDSLKTNSRVLFAEPNYIREQESVQKTDGSGSGGSPGAYDVKMDDVTPLQWGNYKDADLRVSGSADPSIHVPHFGGKGSNMKKAAIAAVIDMPVDYKHPDLKNVVYRFSPAEQAKLKCGEYGYNATNKTGKLKFDEGADHGTHCAGILGAAWDGKGISGVASKARIMSVQNAAADGRTSLVNDLRAFAFVKKAKQSGIDIRITSNSWGLVQSSRALNAAVYELGKKFGIVSFFAAGNDAKDNTNANVLDWTLSNNPYVVVVSAMDMNDELANYSSYSAVDSTLGAPGSRILSCVRADSAEYIPDLSRSTNKFYEGFEQATPKVTIRQLNKKGKPVGSRAVRVQRQAAFSGKSSMKLPLDQKYFSTSGNGIRYGFIEIDLGDLSEKKITSADKFRFSVTGSKPVFCDMCKFPQPGKAKEVEMADMGDDSAQWTSPNCTVPENTVLKNMKLTIRVLMRKKTSNTIYIDSIGIGSQRVPYSFYDGTSMATPQAAGAALVLAGNNTKLRGAALARKVASMTRPNKTLKGKTRTGGVLDFRSSSASGSKVKSGPVITSLKVKGKKVTIKGAGLGKKKGKVRIYKFVTGKKDAKKKAKIAKWSSGKVVLKFRKKFKGIMKVTLTIKDGRSFTIHKYIRKSRNVYKKDLPLGRKTGDPFKFDARGDFETNGPLTAAKGKLYYLPQLTRIEQTPACKRFMRYDIKKKKWKRLPDLPEWLEHVSAAYYKGKLVVKGTRMKKAFDGSPVHISPLDNANSRIYVFDLKKYSKLKKGSKKKAWSRASNKNVKLSATILKRKGKLLLAGGRDYKKTSSSGKNSAGNTSGLVRYSLKKGAGKRILKFGRLVDYPSVAVKGKRICVFDYIKYRVFIVNGSKLIKPKKALPSYVMTGSSSTKAISVSEREGVVVPCRKGFILVGPAAKNGSSDTFLLKKGSRKFKALKKRASDARVAAPAAASYKGRLYVIGSSALEKYKRFFRSTKI